MSFDLDCGKSVPDPIDMKNLSLLAMCENLGGERACPNVAPEPSMYCPSVRIGPCAPAPNLMMFVAPNMKPMMRPTAVRNHEQVSKKDRLSLDHTATHEASHLDCQSFSMALVGFPEDAYVCRWWSALGQLHLAELLLLEA